MIDVLPDLQYHVEVNFRNTVYTFCCQEKNESMDLTISKDLNTTSTSQSEIIIGQKIDFNKDEKTFLLPQQEWDMLSVGFLREKLIIQLNLNPSTIRLVHKGRNLKDDQILVADLFAQQNGNKKLGKSYGKLKIMLIGSTEEELKSLQELETKEKVMAEELSINRKGGYEFVPTTSTPHNASHGFTSIETLPGLPNEQEARKILTTLANDPGVLEVMRKRRWKVPILAELYPDGSVGEDPVCILGLNVNQGAKILLRIRTDDLSGFRKLRTIKETLYHELAHNEFGPHDEKFYRLMREITKESDSFNLSGRTLSGTNGGVSRTGQIQGHIEPTRYVKRKVRNYIGGGGKVGENSNLASSSTTSTTNISHLENTFSPTYLAGVAAIMRHKQNLNINKNMEESPTSITGVNNGGSDTELNNKSKIEIGSPENELDQDEENNNNLIIVDEANETNYGSRTKAMTNDKEGVTSTSASTFSINEVSIEEDVDTENIHKTEHRVNENDEAIIAVKEDKDSLQIKQDFEDNTERKQLISQLIGMGFDAQIAKEAVKETTSNLEAAIEYICNKGDMVDLQDNPTSHSTTTFVPDGVEPNSRQHRLILAVEELKIELKNVSSSNVQEVVQTLTKIMDNIMQNPEDLKYQKLRKRNGNFQKRIGCYNGAMNILKAIGFEEQDAKDTVNNSFTTSTYHNNDREVCYVLTRLDIGLLWLGKETVENLLE